MPVELVTLACNPEAFMKRSEVKKIVELQVNETQGNRYIALIWGNMKRGSNLQRSYYYQNVEHLRLDVAKIKGLMLEDEQDDRPGTDPVSV